MDDYNWNPDGDYLSYQEELLWRREEEDAEDSVEVFLMPDYQEGLT